MARQIGIEAPSAHAIARTDRLSSAHAPSTRIAQTKSALSAWVVSVCGRSDQDFTTVS